MTDQKLSIRPDYNFRNRTDLDATMSLILRDTYTVKQLPNGRFGVWFNRVKAKENDHE